jgi:hypothetical protein
MDKGSQKLTPNTSGSRQQKSKSAAPQNDLAGSAAPVAISMKQERPVSA